MKKNKKNSAIQALKIISTWAICANKYSDFERKKTLEQIYELAIKTVKESGETVHE